MEIAQLIQDSPKTREEICVEAGISRGFLSLLERKERKVGTDSILGLSQALGVSPSVLRPDLAALFAPSVCSMDGASVKDVEPAVNHFKGKPETSIPAKGDAA